MRWSSGTGSCTLHSIDVGFGMHSWIGCDSVMTVSTEIYCDRRSVIDSGSVRYSGYISVSVMSLGSGTGSATGSGMDSGSGINSGISSEYDRSSESDSVSVIHGEVISVPGTSTGTWSGIASGSVINFGIGSDSITNLGSGICSTNRSVLDSDSGIDFRVGSVSAMSLDSGTDCCT